MKRLRGTGPGAAGGRPLIGCEGAAGVLAGIIPDDVGALIHGAGGWGVLVGVLCRVCAELKLG